MTVKTAFMWTPVEARRKKTFGDVDAGDLVIYRAITKNVRKTFFVVVFFNRTSPFLSVA